MDHLLKRMEMQPKVRGIKEDHHHRKMGKVTKVIKEAHLLKRTETHLKAREVKRVVNIVLVVNMIFSR